MPEVISQAAPPAAEPDDEAPTRRTAGQRALQLLDAAWRPALLLVLLGFGWWAVTAAEVFPAYLVPTPGDVANELVTEREMLARHTWVTTYETVLGFLLAAAIGMLAAVVIVYSPTLEKALYPLILFAQVIPKIAIAPILVVWFGFGPMPKVILAVLIAFFPVVVSGVAGLRSTDPELLDLSATMGASRWKTFRKIRFPNSLPHLLSGLKVAVTLAVVGAVVGEFVGADEGLGYVLLLASGNLNSSLLFADLILMSALGVVLFVAVEVAEKLLIPWHASRRQGVPLTTS
ncbi:ABC transporter permease [Jiangella alkaliphila]|uniref:NitT/TauT family transport system permease protein n=1 Tax=Jiangella alkaliphila TaxID=419479 RepID=A0A1H2L4R3_9ACTN|nr:ABC transporter permease [Jiangella alkaliphila]SDU76027.1 NitT/TauT family transport system permease protein [Jiangella alkaliphila]